MANRFWASIIKRMLACWLVAFLAGFVFQWIFTDESRDSRLQAGLISVALYIGASFIIGIVNSCGTLLYQSAFMGKDMQEGILADLRAMRAPAPMEWHRKTADYLSEYADDTDLDTEARVRAALIFGVYDTAKKKSGFWGGLLYDEAFNAAVLRYAEEAPKHKKP